MEFGPDYKPELESLKDLLLDMAKETSLNALLKMVVDRLAERPHIALVRIWLFQEGEACPSCPKEDESRDKTECLRLVASAGHSLNDSEEDWSRLDGDFRCFPYSVHNIGEIGVKDKSFEITDVNDDSDWLQRPEWVRREGILGFGRQFLIYEGQVIGEIVIFSRIRLFQDGIFWFRTIANFLAISIINTRAFEEIKRLKKQAEHENIYLREELLEAQAFGEIIGESSPLGIVKEQIELVAPTDANVLILGESGTGKELVAREIHKRSRRQDRPLIKVNCASIPKDLYESEFFGHVKGAFSGAIKDRAGRFEAAHSGTLFLDEVGEIPLELQSKLLRVLQEGQYERVGEEVTRHVDVRIIASTNRDLKKEVEERRFRQDLYYRLNVFPIEVAPLRHRKGDIPLLASHFLEVTAKKMNKPVPQLTHASLIELHHYDWPGNVRELQNIIERALITSQPRILKIDLPNTKVPDSLSYQVVSQTKAHTDEKILTHIEMKERERENILAALRKSAWKIYGAGGAAELLGTKPTTLTARIKKMGINKLEHKK